MKYFNYIWLGIIICGGVTAMELEQDITTDFNALSKPIEKFVQNYKLTGSEGKVLGYAPKPILALEKESCVIKQWPTLRIHGFGGHGNEIIGKSSFLMPGDYLSFDLPDHQLQEKVFAITKTSFGQASEIVPTIKILYDILQVQGMDRIDIQADSRGAAVFINTLAALYEPSNAIDNLLQRLFINSFERSKIAEKVEKGCHFLCWPLRDISGVVQQHIETVSDSITPAISGNVGMVNAALNWIKSISQASTLSSVEYVSMPAVTAYKPWNETVGKSLNMLNSKNKKFTFLMLTQKEDRAVTNKGEIEYYLNLPAHPENKYWVPGKVGRHMQLDLIQIAAINAYRKKYGASYYNDIAQLKEGEAALTEAHATPDNIQE